MNLAVAKQVENIENAINKNVDGLIVAPMDGSAVIPALEKAKTAGIPVIIADAAIDEDMRTCMRHTSVPTTIRLDRKRRNR